jgi:predicted nucleic acid-binding protein
MTMKIMIFWDTLLCTSVQKSAAFSLWVEDVSIQKMLDIGSSKIVAPFYQNTHCHIPLGP